MKHVSGKRMCKILERRGWELIRVNGSHHVYGNPAHTISISVPVHADKDLSTGTQGRIMKQAGLVDADL